MNAGGSGRQFVAVSTASLGQGSFAMRGMLLNGFFEESENTGFTFRPVACRKQTATRPKQRGSDHKRPLVLRAD
jgi:hypothetical protein